jgi:hypothetical protein
MTARSRARTCGIAPIQPLHPPLDSGWQFVENCSDVCLDVFPETIILLRELAEPSFKLLLALLRSSNIPRVVELFGQCGVLRPQLQGRELIRQFSDPQFQSVAVGLLAHGWPRICSPSRCL